MILLAAYGGVAVLVACNDILDIREAAPKPVQTPGGSAGASDGSAGSEGSSGGDSGHGNQAGTSAGSAGAAATSGCDAAPGTCSQVATDDCRSCLESACSGELAACLREPFCRDALIDYSTKLVCSCCTDQGTRLEVLKSAGVEADAFADCLRTRCLPRCAGQGMACFVYCECMGQDHCKNQRSAWDGGTCLEQCAKAPDLACQADHCEIARTSTNQIDIDRHCGHAVGISCCNTPGFLCPTPSPLCQ